MVKFTQILPFLLILNIVYVQCSEKQKENGQPLAKPRQLLAKPLIPKNVRSRQADLTKQAVAQQASVEGFIRNKLQIGKLLRQRSLGFERLR